MVVVRCQNPTCPSRLKGEPRIIVEASEGSVIRGLCKSCKQFTETVVLATY